MLGPFQPDIMPVVSKVHYDDVKEVWVVKVSRQIKNGDGVKRETARQSFVKDDYAGVLTYISRFWGNA
jgi:hypothetical protein